MSEEMNKEAEVQEEAVDIPVTDGSEEEAADTAQAAEEEASDDTAAPEETEQQTEEAESQKEPETKTKTSFFGKKKKEKDKFEQQIEDLTDRLKRSMAEFTAMGPGVISAMVTRSVNASIDSHPCNVTTCSCISGIAA